jgi:hypothetical protein
MSLDQRIDAWTSGREPVSDADYVQLSRFVIDFVWRIDNGYADSVHELWTEDGELDLGFTIIRGKQAIAEWGKQLVDTPAWQTIRHVCGNMHFVSDGDDAAFGTTVLTVFMDPDGSKPSEPFSIGEDHDRFVRTENGWRLASRQWVESFSRGDGLTLP